MARPVRLALAETLGGDVDGAWWPYSNSVADELPGLIEALHRPLGEIVDICINWPVTKGPLDLETLVGEKRRVVSADCTLMRLMFVDGRRGCAKLLVVPHMTSSDLGGLVMRGAAAMPVGGLERDSRMFATADLVIRTAQVQSAEWSARMRTTEEASRA